MTERKRILYLEDEVELLETMGLLLQEQGYDVTVAKNAEEALEIAQGTTFNLILADIKLPGIDGFEFLKKVRQIEHCRTVPFVFLTAFNNLKAAMDAKKEGAAEYVTKPFDFEYLVARIKALTPP